jgi:hypothetical protein
MKNISLTSTSSFINLSNHQKKANGFCDLFSRRKWAYSIHYIAHLPHISTENEARWKCMSYGTRFIMSAEKAKKRKKGTQSLFSGSLFYFSATYLQALRGGDIIVFEFATYKLLLALFQ